MNERIADMIAQQIVTLNFISKASGCIQILTRGKETFPAALQVYEATPSGVTVCPRTEDYTAMVPDSAENGLAYFEDKGSERIGKDARKETWVGTLKLVCWLNMNKIGPKAPGLILEALMSSVSAPIPNSGYVLGGKLEASRVLPKAPSPFDAYSYDESRTQFMAFPYDYFSMELKYRIYTQPNCPVSIELEPVIC